MRTLRPLKKSFRTVARYGAALSKAFAVATGDVDELCDDLVELDILFGRTYWAIDSIASHPTSRPGSPAAHSAQPPCEVERALTKQPLASPDHGMSCSLWRITRPRERREHW